MAATTLVKELLWRVSQQLGDVNPQFIRWTEKELVNWLNDGQRLIASIIPASCARTDVIKLAAGTRQSIDSVPAASIKPGDGSSAQDTSGTMLLGVVRNMGADGATPGRAIRLVERDALDAADPNWHTSSDSSVLEFCFDRRQAKVFYVYPGVDTTAPWVEVSWLVSPYEVPYVAGSLLQTGNSTIKLSIDDMYVDALVEYILTKSYLKLTEQDKEQAAQLSQLATTHATIFSGLLKTDGSRRDQNPNLQLLPFQAGVAVAAK